MKRRIITLFLFILCIQSQSQQLFFTGYSLQNGLSQSVVTCILQDSRGYIWFGTQNGLNRFNGYSFEVFTYRPDDTTSISNNWIYGMAEDRHGNLWIGTKGGLNCFLQKEKRFTRIHYGIPYPVDVTDYVYDVKCSRNGSILINTPPVLSILDPDRMEFSHAVAPLAYDGSIKDYNIPLLEDTNGQIWTGSTFGLARYSPRTGNFRLFQPESSDISDAGNNITALWQDRPGDIWAGSAGGVYRVSSAGETESKLLKETGFSLSNNFVRAITGDPSGGFWVATEGGGLNLIRRDAHKGFISEVYSTGTNGLNHNIVLSLMVDRSMNLWIGTLSGVNKTDLKKQKFRLYRQSDSPYSVDLTGNVIASLYKDSVGTIWIGTWGQGLNLYDRMSGKTRHFSSVLPGKNNLPNDYVHTIFEDSAHSIWIGTRDGLMVFNPGTGGFVRPRQFPENPGLPDFRGLRIFRMVQTQNGDFWIATQDGLFRIQRGAKPERYHSDGPENHRISGNLVYALMEDSDGLIWIGTSEGLDLLDPATQNLRHFKKGKINSLADNFITALCEDHRGNIWIGTSSYVNRYSKKDSVFTYYAKDQGLPGNLVYSIVEDKNGKMWFATGNGLCRYNPAEDNFHSFSVEEGMQSPEFNLGASCVSRDGEVFFGGMNGFNSFYPDSLIDNPYLPEIVFTSAYKMKKGVGDYFDLEGNNRIVLNYNDYAFTVEFSALEFTNPSKNRYKYRLEGADNEWINIGNRNFVAFSNLPPGKYTLRVAGSNNDGIWNETGASLGILIRPPWWRSLPAYIGYIILAFATIFLIFKRREYRHISDMKILEEKVKERTLQIEKQKTEILQKNLELNNLNASKDKFFSIIAHDLRNPFNSISGLTEILLMDLDKKDPSLMKKPLENIRNSSQQAHELLENLLLWARAERGIMDFRPETVNLRMVVEECIALVTTMASRKNISLDATGVTDVVVWADANMLMTVVRNLLTNAVKFTHLNGEVRVELQTNNGNCILSVKDNGTGISPEKMEKLFTIGNTFKTKGTGQEPGTGLGLVLCREFVEKHDGTIEVESTPGAGSIFRVILPLREI